MKLEGVKKKEVKSFVCFAKQQQNYHKSNELAFAVVFTILGHFEISLLRIFMGNYITFF